MSFRPLSPIHQVSAGRRAGVLRSRIAQRVGHPRREPLAERLSVGLGLAQRSDSVL